MNEFSNAKCKMRPYFVSFPVGNRIIRVRDAQSSRHVSVGVSHAVCNVPFAGNRLMSLILTVYRREILRGVYSAEVTEVTCRVAMERGNEWLKI